MMMMIYTTIFGQEMMGVWSLLLFLYENIRFGIGFLIFESMTIKMITWV